MKRKTLATIIDSWAFAKGTGAESQIGKDVSKSRRIRAACVETDKKRYGRKQRRRLKEIREAVKMGNTMDKLGELLKEKEIEFKTSDSTVYSYYAPFRETARLKGCNMQIIPSNGKMRICAELPLRIRRKECYSIGCIIAKMNSSLPEFSGYTLDPISGLLQFAAQYSIPKDAETLGKILGPIVRCVEEDIDVFFDVIHEAENEKPMEDEDSEDDRLDEDSECTGKSTSLSILKKIVNFFGTDESEEKD